MVRKLVWRSDAQVMGSYLLRLILNIVSTFRICTILVISCRVCVMYVNKNLINNLHSEKDLVI
ncbi:hypothetical protein GCM10008018_65340 [Paenibacillus marchantiophytorum]|uniref:Uncharacterized protein n=1 Tax=Paenibacillus marchantiophytorum TaxID=1619310 RepID=A0ABQ1FHM6_9BACL|nr:hypothetical protein GCM10008018_65340 [Paenibacillus marchantiophytorum]